MFAERMMMFRILVEGSGEEGVEVLYLLDEMMDSVASANHHILLLEHFLHLAQIG